MFVHKIASEVSPFLRQLFRPFLTLLHSASVVWKNQKIRLFVKYMYSYIDLWHPIICGPVSSCNVCLPYPLFWLRLACGGRDAKKIKNRWSETCKHFVSLLVRMLIRVKSSVVSL